ncbi:MAG: flavin reductase family protein [Pseudomonadota bacterium]
MNADANLNMNALNEAELKRAMGCFATGVTVVTAHHNGEDIAMTCNSFNTVSLDPAMVLWSIQKDAASHPMFLYAGGYTVNILAAGQGDLAMQFATAPHEERFNGVATERLSTGRLMLTESIAWFDCSLEQAVEAGDHDILIGRVLSFASNDGDPLLYVKGQFA